MEIWEATLCFNLIWVILLNTLIINYGVYRENFQDMSSVQTEKRDLSLIFDSFPI